MDGYEFAEIKDLDNLINVLSLRIEHENTFIVKLKEIKSLDNLQKLEQLFVNNNCIFQIRVLDRLSNIKELSLNNNQISDIKGLITQ